MAAHEGVEPRRTRDILATLGVKIDVWFFESEVDEPSKAIIDELIQRGIAQDERPEGGPVIVKIDEKLGLKKEKYRTAMTGYGTQNAQIQIWQKPPYVKEQIKGMYGGTSTTMTVIHRPDGNYTYDTAQGKYVLTPDVTSFSSWLQYFDSETLKGLLNNQSLGNLQKVTLDGKQATLFNYSLSVEEVSVAVQMWIWNDYGVPLKASIDMDMKEMAMTLDFVFENYSFSDIPDSTFNIT